ncbi:holin [Stutzerimonas nitrititolerans]|uniref:holin n=1 Tax=Stutzerimonas nitrititolerans TaxID=2482751 RepID=UPI0028ABDEEB|nr:holin [Stutzerimonas nitrititolerans]
MSEKTGLAVEVIGASLANKGTVAGAVTGTVGWLVDINWIGLVGVLIAVLGFVVNTYFQVRKDRRDAAESAARLAQLQDRCNLGQ